MVILICVALTAVIGLSTVGLGAAGLATDSSTFQQSTPTNNTTIQHERPDNVSQSGDAEQVSQWLERRLAADLSESAIQVSEGEYERGRELLGDDYDSRLEQYVDVAGQTEGTSDDQTAETINQTAHNQREFAETTGSYEETYDAYQEARENGNESRARALARKLESLAERTTGLNESLNRNYATVENGTGVDTSEPQQATSNTTENITTRQTTVRNQTFIQTQLTIETDEPAVAFDDPMMMRGRIMTENGTAVANERIKLSIFSRQYTIQTDQDGRFTVQYRPVSLPVNTTAVSVQYTPENSSAYLGDETNVATDVSQVNLSLSIANTTAQARYNDTIRTNVIATVHGQPVPALPVQLTFGTSSTGITDVDGQVTIEQQVPATVSDGERPLRMAYTAEGRAVSPASTTAAVIINETPTNITAQASSENERIVVSGQLITTSGDQVDNQPISVAIGGTTLNTDTNQNGQYRVVLTDTADVETTNQSVATVTAQFDGSGTNLADSRAETTVTLATIDGTTDAGFPITSDILWLVLSGVGLLGVIGLLFAVRQRFSPSEEDADPEPTPAVSQVDSSSATETQSIAYLDRARSALTDGDIEHATIAAYAAVRSRLQHQADLSSSLTHREFVEACRNAGADIQALLTVTDTYERAAFAASLDRERTQQAVEAAESFISDDDERSDERV